MRADSLVIKCNPPFAHNSVEPVNLNASSPLQLPLWATTVPQTKRLLPVADVVPEARNTAACPALPQVPVTTARRRADACLRVIFAARMSAGDAQKVTEVESETALLTPEGRDRTRGANRPCAHHSGR